MGEAFSSNHACVISLCLSRQQIIECLLIEVKVVILGLDPGIQARNPSGLKTMDSRLRENDGQTKMAVYMQTLKEIFA